MKESSHTNISHEAEDDGTLRHPQAAFTVSTAHESTKGCVLALLNVFM